MLLWIIIVVFLFLIIIICEDFYHNVIKKFEFSICLKFFWTLLRILFLIYAKNWIQCTTFFDVEIDQK